MEINASFEHVSEKEYGAPVDAVLLPRRATAGSAGYDFFAPQTYLLLPGESVTIRTGIRVKMEPGWVLLLFPRSGLGFKYRVRLDNTVGVIDSDYYGADNEGHIHVRLTNCGHQACEIHKDSAFCQGVFLPYGVIAGEAVAEKRTGGFGSTSL